MHSFFNAFFVFILAGLLFVGCKDDPKPKPPKDQPKEQVVKKPVKVPPFNADRAYALVQKQLDFGFRIPGSKAHLTTKDWLVEQFQSAGCQVTEQKFSGRFPEGNSADGYNIIASINPEHTKRILLGAHWDSRYISDHDPQVKDKPVHGADDGGSGVGVLLALAEAIKEHPIDMGIDFVLFDFEDQGVSGGESAEEMRTWCQGAQYWAANLIPAGYSPEYGILLDMVGAENARFVKEGYSMKYAPQVVNKVWNLAINMGNSQYFFSEVGGGLIDDHLFVNQIAGIPMIDIINRSTTTESGFGPYWHTQGDDMSVISKKTLRAVGQTMLALLYQESVGNL